MNADEKRIRKYEEAVEFWWEDQCASFKGQLEACLKRNASREQDIRTVAEYAAEYAWNNDHTNIAEAVRRLLEDNQKAD